MCLFLFGGNDAYNLVLPTDSSSWAAYTATRNQAPDPIALLPPGTLANAGAAAGSPARLGGVLPLAVANARFFGSALAGGTLQRLASTARGSHPFEFDAAAVGARAIAAEAALRTALRPAADAAFGTAPASGN